VLGWQSHEKAVQHPNARLTDRNRPLNEGPALGAEAAYTSPMALIASWEICAGDRSRLRSWRPSTLWDRCDLRDQACVAFARRRSLGEGCRQALTDCFVTVCVWSLPPLRPTSIGCKMNRGVDRLHGCVREKAAVGAGTMSDVADERELICRTGCRHLNMLNFIRWLLDGLASGKMMFDAVPLTGKNLSRSNAFHRPAGLPRCSAIDTKIVVRERRYRPAWRAESNVPPSDAASLRSHHKNLGQFLKPRRSDDVCQPTGLQNQTANPS
jgi:hypothetical protein